MIRQMTKTKRATAAKQSDSAYFLKLVLYLVLGSQWIFLLNPDLSQKFPLPIGLIIGLFFTTREHFKIDRKIEYAVLLVAAFIGFWSTVGLSIIIS
jgi:hypothetical protein